MRRLFRRLGYIPVEDFRHVLRENEWLWTQTEKLSDRLVGDLYKPPTQSSPEKISGARQ